MRVIGMKHVSSDPDSIHGHQGLDDHKEELKSDLGKSTGHQGHDAHAGDLKSDLEKSTGYQRHDAHTGDLKSDLGKSTGHQGQDAHKVESKGSKGDLGKSTVISDPRAQKDPSRLSSRPLNFESKVTDPTHTGGKEADLSKMQHLFENLGVGSNPKSYDPNHPENLRHDTITGIGSNRKSDPNHPENLPHDTLTGNQSSKSRSYTEKISSSDKAAADKAATDKAAAAKDVIASKLGYSGPKSLCDMGKIYAADMLFKRACDLKGSLEHETYGCCRTTTNINLITLTSEPNTRNNSYT